MAELKKTPLNRVHRALGARMIDFGGWDMPVQYEGLTQEHMAVRERAGLFDVSHMGECRLEGPDAERAADYLLTNDVTAMADGQILYSPMANESGGCVDDLIVYRFSRENYLLVINASNIDKDLAWIGEKTSPFRVTVRDESPLWGQLALQGPRAQEILAPLIDADPASIGFFTFRTCLLSGEEVLLSRSGYTGEDGFEIYGRTDSMEALWNRILGEGKGAGLVPVGLGARDTLRFEAALPLYGNELAEDISPLEAGLAPFVKLERGDFIGRDALLKQKEEGLTRRIAGFEMTGKGIPRHGYPIFDSRGREIGTVTTGYRSPSTGRTIGLGLMEKSSSGLGNEIRIGIRKKRIPAVIVKKKFYTKQYRK